MRAIISGQHSISKDSSAFKGALKKIWIVVSFDPDEGFEEPVVFKLFETESKFYASLKITTPDFQRKSHNAARNTGLPNAVLSLCLEDLEIALELEPSDMGFVAVYSVMNAIARALNLKHFTVLEVGPYC